LFTPSVEGRERPFDLLRAGDVQPVIRDAHELAEHHARSRLNEADDATLVALAKQGRKDAMGRIVQRYHGFVRLKASSYSLAGGDCDDLVQEGLVGLYRAVRDYGDEQDSSFRNFAELCVTRQIITAVRSATRRRQAMSGPAVAESAPPYDRPELAVEH